MIKYTIRRFLEESRHPEIFWMMSTVITIFLPPIFMFTPLYKLGVLPLIGLYLFGAGICFILSSRVKLSNEDDRGYVVVACLLWISSFLTGLLFWVPAKLATIHNTIGNYQSKPKKPKLLKDDKPMPLQAAYRGEQVCGSCHQAVYDK